MSEAVDAGAVVTSETPGEVSVETPDTPEGGEQTWFGEFSADDKDFLNKKGWDQDGKGPADVIQGYRNLEKMRGGDPEMQLTLPDRENPDEVAAFNLKLGVPETVDGYGQMDLEFAGQKLDDSVLAGMSHKAGLTPDQHKTYSAGVAEYLNQTAEAQAQAREETDIVEKNALESEWGTLSGENYQAASKAALRFGVDADQLNKIQTGGLGYRGTIELFTQIGRSFGEAQAPAAPDSGGSDAPFGLTKEVAKGRLDALTKDADFRGRMEAGDTEAREQWNRLKNIAFR